LNSINGKISHTESEGSFQLIEVTAGTDKFKSIIIKNDAEHYQKGDDVILHFKETEVSLASKKLPEISLQNQIEGKIIRLEKDLLLSRLELDTVHGPLASIITTASAERLDFVVGGQAVALIKTTEVMLSKA